MVRYIEGGAPTRAFTVTPSNDDDLPHITLGIYLSAQGDVACVMADDADPVTFTDLVGGVEHRLRIKKILATGTDAVIIVAVY